MIFGDRFFGSLGFLILRGYWATLELCEHQRVHREWFRAVWGPGELPRTPSHRIRPLRPGLGTKIKQECLFHSNDENSRLVESSYPRVFSARKRREPSLWNRISGLSNPKFSRLMNQQTIQSQSWLHVDNFSIVKIKIFRWMFEGYSQSWRVSRGGTGDRGSTSGYWSTRNWFSDCSVWRRSNYKHGKRHVQTWSETQNLVDEMLGVLLGR